MKKLWIAIVVVIFSVSALAVSCTGKTEKETVGAGKADTSAEKLVEIVNTHCPLMGTPLGKSIPEKMTRLYEGKRIGFCCTKCLKDWDAMNDKEKKATYEKALKPVKAEEKKQ